MRPFLLKLEALLEREGTGKKVFMLAGGGISVAVSFFENRFGFRIFPFDAAWFAIAVCGVPILLEAVIGVPTCLSLLPS